MSQAMVLSRCDRLGDLILSLPALGLIRDAGIPIRVLHCSAYAKDIGEWALFNGLCTQVWIEGEKFPLDIPKRELSALPVLSLFYSKAAVSDFRTAGLKRILGPRNRLAALWNYRKSISQHRSRVEKSEAAYNIDLAKKFVKWVKIPIPDFRGLPALQIPPKWKSTRSSPGLVIVVANAGSARNWPVEKYIEIAERALKSGRSVDFLVSGQGAEEKRAALMDSGIVHVGEGSEKEAARAGIAEEFATVGELVSWLSEAEEVMASSTGPLHIAHAAGVPVFGIYPSKPLAVSFRRWRPDGYWHSAAVRYISLDE